MTVHSGVHVHRSIYNAVIHVAVILYNNCKSFTIISHTLSPQPLGQDSAQNYKSPLLRYLPLEFHDSRRLGQTADPRRLC